MYLTKRFAFTVLDTKNSKFKMLTDFLSGESLFSILLRFSSFDGRDCLISGVF